MRGSHQNDEGFAQPPYQNDVGGIDFLRGPSSPMSNRPLNELVSRRTTDAIMVNCCVFVF
jgi:hypothetical protein